MATLPPTRAKTRAGDSLERTIERMRAFNKQRYWSMLDDDFSQHVNAF